jgi:murein DD-endopeptidase MepM/ murein hydrolase activator NlpD
MRKFNLELPKFRLELHAKLVKRRKPLVDDPFVPTPSVVNKKYRSGTFLGKIARHLSGHKNTKKFFAANLSALAIVGTLLPGTQTSVQAASFNTQPDETVIQAQNTLKTEKSIQYPLETFKINQGFSIFHFGVDLGAKIGDPIKPIKAGTIVEAEYATDGYGNTVLIDHGKGLTSRYAHLSKIEASVGDLVTTENEIGEVGMTGHTTGPHLHLEIRQNGIPLNPISVLSSR